VLGAQIAANPAEAWGACAARAAIAAALAACQTPPPGNPELKQAQTAQLDKPLIFR
jgi:hypothetical protein